MKKLIVVAFFFVLVSVLFYYAWSVNKNDINTNAHMQSNTKEIYTDEDWVTNYKALQAKSSNDEEKVKETINMYLKIQCEELLKLKQIDTDFMVISNSAMEEEKILRACHIEKLSKLGEHYLDYELITDFKDITLTKDKAQVRLVAGYDFHYASTPDQLSSVYGPERLIKLVKRNNRWMISEDIYEDYIKKALKKRDMTPLQYLELLKKGEDLRDLPN